MSRWPEASALSEENVADYKALIAIFMRAADAMANRKFQGTGAWIV